MKKLIFIAVFVGFGLGSFAQSVGTFRRAEVRTDTLRLKDLDVHPDSIRFYNTIYTKQDTLFRMDTSGVYHKLLTRYDSIRYDSTDYYLRAYVEGALIDSTKIPAGSGGSGANTALSNLTTTSINQTLIPAAHNTYSLGVAGTGNWAYGYIYQIISTIGSFSTSSAHGKIYVKELATDADTVPNYGTIFARSSDGLPYWKKDDGTVLGMTGGAGSMVYPGAGIALSTGSAWGTSITNNSSNWNTAYGWGNHATAGYMTNPMTTAGDMIIGGVSGAPARVAAGTDGYIWTMVSGTPTWAVNAGGSGANTALSNLSSVAINTSLLPGTSDGAALGSTSKMWSDLFLASGGIINANNGAATMTFLDDLISVSGADFAVPDEAYGAGWNGSLDVPTKNAVYDKIETISGGSTNPAGSASEWQYRSGATTFGAIGNTFVTSNNPGLSDGGYFYIGTDLDYRIRWTGTYLEIERLASGSTYYRAIEISSSHVYVYDPSNDALVASFDDSGIVTSYEITAGTGFTSGTSEGVTGTFPDNNGNQVTVTGGLVTGIGAPSPAPSPQPAAVIDSDWWKDWGLGVLTLAVIFLLVKVSRQDKRIKHIEQRLDLLD